MKAIREAGGWDQPTFAEMLNEEAKRQDVPAPKYDRSVISKMEKGRRDVSLTDAALAAMLDPKDRGVAWVAGVRQLKSHRRGVGKEDRGGRTA